MSAAGLTTVVVVLLWAALLLRSSSAAGSAIGRSNDDDDDDGVFRDRQHSWCQKEECTCVTDTVDGGGRRQRVSIVCTFSGDKDVIWEPPEPGDNKTLLTDALTAVELRGDGRCRLTVRGRTFAAFAGLRTWSASGFAEATVQRLGLQVRGRADTGLTVTVARVGQLRLDTDAVRPAAGAVDVTLDDCDEAWLDAEVAARLRSFAFRRIGRLHLSENTFKNAAEKSAIERVLLEDLTADKLPSHAFITTIDQLSITNCTFGTIERNAFPVNTIGNVTLTNVTVDRIEGEAFQHSSFITNLRMTGCRVREMETNAVMSAVQSILIEQSQFGWIRASAVSVADKLTLCNNTFDRVDGRGFVLHSLHSVRVDGNTFARLDPDAFYESAGARQPWPSLLVRDNVFRHRAGDAPWPLPAVRLREPAAETDVAGNRFVGGCGCGPWRFVATDGDNGTTGGGGDGGGDYDDDDDDDGFAGRNYCRPDAAAAACANLTASGGREYRIDEFADKARCRDDGDGYELCAAERRSGAATDAGGRFRFLGGTLMAPGLERGVVTTVVLLILCGFGAVCAVSAVTWLNARGYFIKLRSLLTSCGRGGRGGGGGGGGGGRGDGSGGDVSRTTSAHSLSPMSVHEYAVLQKPPASALGVRVIVYQDKGTQTVPEELTHEMLQTLRDKLDDPDDYAEARGMIEHLYDLIRVEENCCGGGGTGWYSSGGLDDMTSTITTKAVTVGPDAGGGGSDDDGGGRDVVSVGTSAPSLDRLWPPRINVHPKQPSAASSRDSGGRHRWPRRPPPPPSVGDDYMDPADLLCGGDYDGYGGDGDDDDDDADIYCELADLRPASSAGPVPPPPPVPRKPTEL